MKLFKRLKDPVYGYVDIPIKFMNEIVDTAPFQRLRRVIQASYSPLYSSAVHNRFVHSLGVFHLGEIAVNALREEEETVVKEVLERFGNTFLLACLLHDVGHAPFSHTGESFYLNETQDYDELHSMLRKSVNDKEFDLDIPKEKKCCSCTS